MYITVSADLTETGCIHAISTCCVQFGWACRGYALWHFPDHSLQCDRLSLLQPVPLGWRILYVLPHRIDDVLCDDDVLPIDWHYYLEL